MKLKINNLFSDEALTNYDLFIEKLKQLKESGHTTREILELVFQYYEKYVTYNYDQLQIVKMKSGDVGKPAFKCYQAYMDIVDRIDAINEVSKKGEETIESLIEKADKKPYSRDEAIKMLDEAFLKVEGRPLTDRNKELLFSNYGEFIHRPYEPMQRRKNGIISMVINEVIEHDEIVIPGGQYPPKYINGMLRDGVCSTYAGGFEKRICNDLEIKHMFVTGIGTTSHSWSLIFLPEEQRWTHFDMTMVKFYQDKWIKTHEPYIEQDWIAATTEEIFKMQPTREIHSINGKKCFFDKDNYEKLDINEFDSTILPSEIGKSTIDVPVTQKVEAQTSVNLDSQIHGLEEKQVESLDGE